MVRWKISLCHTWLNCTKMFGEQTCYRTQSRAAFGWALDCSSRDLIHGSATDSAWPWLYHFISLSFFFSVPFYKMRMLFLFLLYPLLSCESKYFLIKHTDSRKQSNYNPVLSSNILSEFSALKCLKYRLRQPQTCTKYPGGVWGSGEKSPAFCCCYCCIYLQAMGWATARWRASNKPCGTSHYTKSSPGDRKSFPDPLMITGTQSTCWKQCERHQNVPSLLPQHPGGGCFLPLQLSLSARPSPAEQRELAASAALFSLLYLMTPPKRYRASATNFSGGKLRNELLHQNDSFLPHSETCALIFARVWSLCRGGDGNKVVFFFNLRQIHISSFNREMV